MRRQGWWQAPIGKAGSSVRSSIASEYGGGWRWDFDGGVTRRTGRVLRGTPPSANKRVAGIRYYYRHYYYPLPYAPQSFHQKPPLVDPRIIYIHTRESVSLHHLLRSRSRSGFSTLTAHHHPHHYHAIPLLFSHSLRIRNRQRTRQSPPRVALGF